MTERRRVAKSDLCGLFSRLMEDSSMTDDGLSDRLSLPGRFLGEHGWRTRAIHNIWTISFSSLCQFFGAYGKVVLSVVALLVLLKEQLSSEQPFIFFTCVFLTFLWLRTWRRSLWARTVQTLDTSRGHPASHRRTADLGLRHDGCKIVLVREPHSLHHLDCALRETLSGAEEIVVLAVPAAQGADAGAMTSVVTPCAQVLLTAVTDLTKRRKRSALLLPMTAGDVFFAVAQAAEAFQAAEVILPHAAEYPVDFQAAALALRWGAVEPDGRHDLVVRIIADTEEWRFII
jgi:hypothetical protein